MLNIVVCIKQVPMVSELPWDPRSGTLMREIAEGMINPACKHALEAALRLKNKHGGSILVVTMGPPMAEEILREAIAMGADRGILISDPLLAGSDTLVTSLALAQAIKKDCADFDLVMCGCYTSDSETAQVGPQLTEELNVPGVAYVDQLEYQKKGVLHVQRTADGFLETMEVPLPGLVTVSTRHYSPRYAPLAGLQEAFEPVDIIYRTAADLEIEADSAGGKGSPTRILDVYSPSTDKENIILKGTPTKVVNQLLQQFEDLIGGAIGKDLKAHNE
jgi:electron transfer flavoprotein beta subunit